MDKYNVICIKWGNKYPSSDVNKLYNMVRKNTSFDIAFHCFTDNDEGLDSKIIVHPLPEMDMDMSLCKYAYRKEAGLCDDNLGGLNGQRVLFFDIDMLIIDNIDELFTLPKDDEFYIINDWNSKGNKVGQASCYSWKIGTLGFAKEYFENNAQECLDKFYTASQEYLSSKVIEKYGKLNFWPKKWFRSFRHHCLPLGIFRKIITAKIPKGSKVLVFHGAPEICDAIKGHWTEEKGVIPKWKKVLYKKVKPTPWIEKYWNV